MLAEPVLQSCQWLDVLASRICRVSAAGRCDWYHGSWQYLRVLGLVSSPTWHSDFYLDAIRATAPPSSRVLVSGCADYSMFAHVSAALGGEAHVTALDWCTTPLVANDWYARHTGLRPPRQLLEDAADHRPAAAYDLIVTDSFVPRFEAGARDRLLAAWRESLAPGGAVITAVRIHDESVAADVGRRDRATLWRETAEQAADWWPTVSQLPVTELAERVEAFARRQERNAIYQLQDLIEVFVRAGFTDPTCEVATVAGKHFARIIAT